MLNLFKPKVHVINITDRSSAMVLIFFSVLLVLVSLSLLLSPMCLDDIGS